MPARERMRGWADGRVLLLDALSCIELPLQQRGCRDWVRVALRSSGTDRRGPLRSSQSSRAGGQRQDHGSSRATCPNFS